MTTNQNHFLIFLLSSERFINTVACVLQLVHTSCWVWPSMHLLCSACVCVACACCLRNACVLLASYCFKLFALALAFVASGSCATKVHINNVLEQRYETQQSKALWCLIHQQLCNKLGNMHANTKCALNVYISRNIQYLVELLDNLAMGSSQLLNFN